MSWTDEEIDNLFQESAKTQTFEYKDAYFSEVEAMLPVNKKGKDFLWMGTALIFIAALTTGYFVNYTGENSFNRTNDQLANLELNTEINTTNTNGAFDSKSSSESQQTVNGNAELNDQLTNTDVTSNSAANVGSKNFNLKNGTSDQIVSNKQLGNQSAGVNAKSIGNTVQQNGFSQSPSSTGSSAGLNQAKTPKGQLSNLQLGTETFIEKESRAVCTPITAGLNVNEANQLNQGLDRNVSANSLMPVLLDLRPKAAFYFELNAGMSQSLVSPKQYTSTSYGGGFGVESHLGNFNLTTGLNFKLSDHRDLVLTRVGTGKIYGFGSIPSKTNTYDFKEVYSIEMPITVGYNFEKHNLNIGVRPSFSYGAKMKEQTYLNNELQDSRESVGLIDEGIKRFGLKPTLGYSYHINKWTVGANIGVQLMQSIDEEYIEGINNNFPIDGQIYLRRTIRLRK